MENNDKKVYEVGLQHNKAKLVLCRPENWPLSDHLMECVGEAVDFMLEDSGCGKPTKVTSLVGVVTLADGRRAEVCMTVDTDESEWSTKSFEFYNSEK